MITQNPVIGRARKKLGNIYARTMYGKNILQTCPPSTKGHQTIGQVACNKAFGSLSQMSNQVSASLLTSLYYEAPQGRSRRGQWCKDLGSGMVKNQNTWEFSPELITQLGSNPKVSETSLATLVTSNQLRINIDELSHVGNAILNEKPCLILIQPETNICISMLDFTTLDGQDLILQNISQTIIGKTCWIFPLWLVNIGTIRNPIYQYGSFVKNTSPTILP